MRLLNVDSLQLEEFLHESPPYAILSHTWGSEEVSFNEIRNSTRKSLREKAGGRKIVGFCDIAALEGTKYVWVDTCCIDKSSSAELSESINSMFAWYGSAQQCYVYLQDIDLEQVSLPGEEKAFSQSKWFTRGWTLQELLAPSSVMFYSEKWRRLGDKRLLWKAITRATRIAPLFLENFRAATMAQRLSWASRRVTTRPEDTAYCLLGLVRVNMPLLYGEGGRKAFERLQIEIINSSDDQSVLAWRATRALGPRPLLAPSPVHFENCVNLFRNDMPAIDSFSIAAGRLQLQCLVDQKQHPDLVNSMLQGHPDIHLPSGKDWKLVPLNCYYYRTAEDYDLVGLVVARYPNETSYLRYGALGLGRELWLSLSNISSVADGGPPQTMSIRGEAPDLSGVDRYQPFDLSSMPGIGLSASLVQSYPGFTHESPSMQRGILSDTRSEYGNLAQ